MIPLLNDLGAAAGHAGALMLLQTASLVLVLLLIEFGVGRRLRSTLRCALWLLVVAKLLLPPSLKLPTGVGYWLGPWIAAPKYVTPPARMTVTMTDVESLTVPSSVMVPAPLPPMRPRLDFFGGLALVWLAGSVALGGWVIRRNGEVHRLVREAESAPPEFQEPLREAAARIGLRRLPELRFTRANHSPAVCGLLRPVIVLPAALTQRLTPAALSDVLLHELVHVQRRDLWLNLPQAVAQVLWWWNPCVWLANARIRALREQAVDERVMLARPGDPATYPATLVEVARHCAARPAVMLSFVGILESRRALRSRVERLLNSGVPCRAGLGWSGWLVVVVVALLALPMAFARRVEVQAPPVPAGMISPPGPRLEVRSDEPRFLLEGQPVGETELEGRLREMTAIDPEVTLIVRAEIVDRQDGLADVAEAARAAGIKRLYLVPPATAVGDEAPRSNISGFITLDPASARGAGAGIGPVSRPGVYQMDPVLARRYGLIPQPETNATGGLASPSISMDPIRVRQIRKEVLGAALPSVSMDPILAQRYDLTGRLSPTPEADTNAATASRPNFHPLDPSARTNPIYTGAGRQRIQNKLDRIVLNEVKFDGVPLSEVVEYLDEQARARDPERQGLNFIIDSTLEVIPSAVLQIDPRTGQPVDLGRVLIRLAPGLRDVRLADALDAIIASAEQPLVYRVEDYAVVFMARPPDIPQLYTRRFEVDLQLFLEAVRAVLGMPKELRPAGKTGASQADAVQEFADWPAPGRVGSGLGSGQQRPGITAVTRTNLMANVQIMVRQFFNACGVDFPALPGQQGARLTPPALGLDGLADPMANQKALFFNDRTGILFVRATLSDLDVIEQAIAALNVAPARSIEKTTRNLNLVTAQVMIKALFAEVEAEAEKALGLDWFVSRPPNPTNASFDVTGKVTGILTGLPIITDSFIARYASLEVTGILTQPQLRTVIEAFEQRGGATLTAAPEFTTGNGNQIRINMTDHTVSLVDPATRPSNGSSVDRNLHMQLRASADLRSVYLTTGAQQNQVVVGDGQTIVLTGGDAAGSSGPEGEKVLGKPAVKRKRLWIFLTPTLLDSSGQRVNPPKSLFEN